MKLGRQVKFTKLLDNDYFYNLKNKFEKFK